MSNQEIVDLCRDLIRNGLMPGKMLEITPQDLSKMKDSLSFNYSEDQFPPRTSLQTLFYAPLLREAISLYLEGFQSKPIKLEKLQIAGLIAYPLLDTALKLLMDQHFKRDEIADRSKGMVLSQRVALSSRNYNQGATVSRISDLFEIYKTYYSGGLRDILVELDEEWLKKSQATSPNTPKGMFTTLDNYRNFALHLIWVHEGIAYLAILLNIVIYADRNIKRN